MTHAECLGRSLIYLSLGFGDISTGRNPWPVRMAVGRREQRVLGVGALIGEKKITRGLENLALEEDCTVKTLH